jgi:hypothetical protein
MTVDATAASLTRRFTDLLVARPADDPALLDRSRLLLLDGFAVAVAGAAERGPGLMVAQARSESRYGPSMVIGQGFTTSVVTLRLNGVGKGPRVDRQRPRSLEDGRDRTRHRHG